MNWRNKSLAEICILKQLLLALNKRNELYQLMRDEWRRVIGDEWKRPPSVD